MKTLIISVIVAFVAMIVINITVELTPGESFILLMLVQWRMYDTLDEQKLIKAMKKAFNVDKKEETT